MVGYVLIGLFVCFVGYIVKSSASLPKHSYGFSNVEEHLEQLAINGRLSKKFAKNKYVKIK